MGRSQKEYLGIDGEVNIKTDFKELEWKSACRNHLAQDRDKWQGKMTNLRVPLDARTLTRCATASISFSRTLYYRVRFVTILLPMSLYCCGISRNGNLQSCG
jgi:hypothetical protein